MPVLHSKVPMMIAAASPAGGSVFMLLQFLLIGIIFWFFLIRPQQQRAKAHRAMIDAVKKGDTVVTAGGIIGRATKVVDDKVEVEISQGVKVMVLKATLSDVQVSGTKKPAND